MDFRRLNAVTRNYSYPLPRIDDALDYVAESCWFSSLDLRSGYWQVELAAEARPKTAFTIGQGLWQFRVMPFGLCNDPATFERLMERVLKKTAFWQLKAALIHAPVLAYPDPNQPFLVDTDASNVGVGAVLSQRGEAGERVVTYYSCSPSRPEINYCITRQELLAVVLLVHHFRPYLLGTKFALRTDHGSLTWMLNFHQPEGQQPARWLEILQEYDFEVQQRPGQYHDNSDALSRRPCLADECRYCGRQDERGLGPSSAAVGPGDSGGDGEPFTTEQLRQ